MSEMVERVARAILEFRSPRLGTSDSDINSIRLNWETVSEGQRVYAREMAVVAIGAMRKPAREMVNGLASQFDGASTAEAVWEAMIDEALK